MPYSGSPSNIVACHDDHVLLSHRHMGILSPVAACHDAVLVGSKGHMYQRKRQLVASLYLYRLYEVRGTHRRNTIRDKGVYHQMYERMTFF
jgi:hypothetical protein